MIIRETKGKNQKQNSVHGTKYKHPSYSLVITKNVSKITTTKDQSTKIQVWNERKKKVYMNDSCY